MNRVGFAKLKQNHHQASQLGRRGDPADRGQGMALFDRSKADQAAGENAAEHAEAKGGTEVSHGRGPFLRHHHVPDHRLRQRGLGLEKSRKKARGGQPDQTAAEKPTQKRRHRPHHRTDKGAAGDQRQCGATAQMIRDAAPDGVHENARKRDQRQHQTGPESQCLIGRTQFSAVIRQNRKHCSDTEDFQKNNQRSSD